MSGAPLDTYVSAAAALQDLPLTPESLALVIANAKILRSMAAQFVDLDLPMALDPAAVLSL